MKSLVTVGDSVIGSVLICRINQNTRGEVVNPDELL